MPSSEMAGFILLFHILGWISAGMFYFMQSDKDIYVNHLVGCYQVTSTFIITLYVITTVATIAKVICNHWGKKRSSAKMIVAHGTTLRTTFPLFNNNLFANAVVRLVPLRYLANVRGTCGKVDGLFRVSEGMSAGVRPMITIQEAFQDEFGLMAWRVAKAFHVFIPNWSMCSAIRDQIVDITSRAHGPTMVIFWLSHPHRRTADISFFSAAKKSCWGLNKRRARQGRTLLEVSQEQGGNTSGGKGFPGCEFLGLYSLKLLQTQASADYPRRHNSEGSKPQNFTQVTGGGSGPKGVTSSGFDHAPGGSHSKGTSYLGTKTDSQEFEGINCDPSNAYSFIVTEDVSPFCFRSFKMAWLRAIALLWQYFQSICMPIRGLLSQPRTVANCVENERQQDTGMKKTMSEKGPINAKDIPSEETDALNMVTGVEKDLRYEGSVQECALLQIQQANDFGSTSSNTVHYEEIEEGLISKPCTGIQEISNPARQSPHTLTGRTDSFMVRGPQKDQSERTGGDNHKAKDDVGCLTNTYFLEVTDDQSTLRRSSFKMAWTRAINIMLQCLQNISTTNRNSVKKIGEFRLSVETEELRSAGKKKPWREKGPINVKGIHSGQNDPVSTFKGNGNNLTKDDADGSNETTASQEDLNRIDAHRDFDNGRDLESEAVVDHLEIEDEDQLDMVLEDAQNVGYIIENPAPIIQLPPLNPMAHVPPLDQRPDAHNILPVWLLAFQAHLANVQAQAQAPLPDPSGPNEEAPVNAQPAQPNNENVPIDDDDEADGNEAEGAANAVVNDDVPANEAAAPPPPPPQVPPPQAGQHAQQPHANGPRNRLLAAARYIKRKFRRNHHHGHPMYYAGAPREERPPLGLEEAAPFPGGLAIQHEEAGEQEERRPRWFSRCFGFLYRHQSAAVQEYPLQGDEAPEFEEVVQVQENVHDEIVEEVAEQVVADEEPLDGLQELQEPIEVL